MSRPRRSNLQDVVLEQVVVPVAARLIPTLSAQQPPTVLLRAAVVSLKVGRVHEHLTAFAVDPSRIAVAHRCLLLLAGSIVAASGPRALPHCMPADRGVPDRTATEERAMPLDLSALFESLREKLVQGAFRIVNDRDEAEDVLQEAFLAVLENPDRDIRYPTTFLATTVRNIALERVRSPRQELPLLIEPAAPAVFDEKPQRLTGRVRGFAGRATSNRVRGKLWLIWKGLAEGRTQREISIELGTTTDAVKALLRRSRRRLGGQLRLRG